MERRVRQARRHPLGDRAELRVALAGDQHHGERQLRQPLPQRLHAARAQAAQRGGEAGRRLRQAHRVGGGGDGRRLVGEQRQRGPVRGERLDPLRRDAICQRVVGGTARGALAGIGEPR